MNLIQIKKEELRNTISNELNNQIKNRLEVYGQLEKLDSILKVSNKWAQTNMIFQCLQSKYPESQIESLSGDMASSPELFSKVADLVLDGEFVEDAWKIAEDFFKQKNNTIFDYIDNE